MGEAPISGQRPPGLEPDEESAAHHLSEREPTRAGHISEGSHHLKREAHRQAHLSALIGFREGGEITPQAQPISDRHSEQITHDSRARGAARVAH